MSGTRFLLGLFFLGATLLSPSISALTFDNQTNRYASFFEESQNYFLTQPLLIKKLFYELSSLKGNPRVSRRIINREIFGCPEGGRAVSNCRLDRLRIERKQKGISYWVTLPVNFTKLSTQPYSKSRVLLTLSWRADLFQPPVFTTQYFLEYINAQWDSKYYTVDRNTSYLQLSASFEEQVTILLSKKIANNLLKLYSSPIRDYRDRITLRYDASSFIKEDGVGYLKTYWKAKLLRINHLRFKVPEREIFD